MTDIETNKPKMFVRREFIAIWVVSVLLILLALVYVRSFEATTRFTTEVQLGSTGTGTQFEPVGTTMSRLQDDILEYAPEDISRKYSISNLKSYIVYIAIASGTAIRLRTAGRIDDRAVVEAVHRY